VNFTALALRIPPKHLVYLLNCIFTAADTVMKRHGLEKIKTIGDAYMAVCGAPILAADHAERQARPPRPRRPRDRRDLGDLIEPGQGQARGHKEAPLHGTRTPKAVPEA